MLDESRSSRSSVNDFRNDMRQQPQPKRSLTRILSACKGCNAFNYGFERSRGGVWTPRQPPASATGRILMPGQESALSPSKLLRARGPPKMAPVAYKVPIMTSETWYKSYEKLYSKRIAFLDQALEDFVVNQIISLMLYMDAENNEKPIHLYINSPGGSVIAGLGLYDTMQHIKSPVITCNLGMAASMASFILGAGVPGKRCGLPTSRVMIHQPASGAEGMAQDPRVEAEQILKIKDTVITMYAHMTGHTREKVEQDVSFDNYMSAQEALAYGIIDHVTDAV